MQVPFKRPIGIELTFVPKDPDPWHINPRNYIGSKSPSDRSWKQLTALYIAYANAAGLKGTGRIHVDYGCVEFPSPILRSWEQARSWYTDAMGVAELAHVTPYEETQEGGCGHIHMGNVNDKLRRKFLIEVWKRPWLTWAFVSPNVNWYARSVDRALEGNYPSYRRFTNVPPHFHMLRYLQYYESRLIQAWFSAQEVQDNYEGFYTAIDASILKSVFAGVFGWKSVITRFTDKTVEWRAFDAAASWEEQEAAIAFYQRFMDWTDKLSAKENDGSFRTEYLKAKKADITLAPGSLRATFRKNMPLCVKNFKHLIDQLELPWDDYEWLIDVNLKPAFAWGKRL